MASGMASTHGPRASPLGRPSEAGRVRQTGAARLWAPRASLALPGSVWERRRRGGAGVMHDVRIPGGVGSLFSEELDLSSEEREKILRIEGSMRSSQLRALYFSQFLSGFGDRVWQFAIPFFLLALQRPDSLTFAVFYALVTGFTNIACGPIVSYSVEKFGRL
ncbi:hypothetical protein T484DRAFT_1803062 [Baffinella frigidus]|nr:hypothetical protein T484DRAFT_1803062 [Cryptophyta sp. CCMP2293]